MLEEVHKDACHWNAGPLFVPEVEILQCFLSPTSYLGARGSRRIFDADQVLEMRMGDDVRSWGSMLRCFKPNLASFRVEMRLQSMWLHEDV